MVIIIIIFEKKKETLIVINSIEKRKGQKFIKDVD